MTMLTVLAFALVAFIGIATPGPTVLLALANGSRFGARRACFGMIGAVLSDFTLIGAVALGLGALLAASEFWFSVVKWIGVGYLAFLGVMLLRSKGSLDAALSRAETEPTYQRSVQSTGVRTVPDVSADADPNTGVLVYTTTPSNGQGSWYQVGGTSLSAPIWAATIAIADQGRVLAHKGTLDGATQTLPALYSAPSTAFHDVTRGSNGLFRSTTTRFLSVTI